MIIKLLQKLRVDLFPESKYVYKGRPVPRTTEILSSMLHEEYLMRWANNIGIFQRKNYITEKDNAATIGTWAHGYIEKFLLSNNLNLDSSCVSTRDMFSKIENAVMSFKLWYDELISINKTEIIGLEQVITCPYFGGTYDMLIKINNRIYLTDFKTSNNMSFKYYLQMAAYRYILRTELGIKIDGIIILQLSKKDISFEEHVVSLHNERHKQFIDLCEETYLSLVHSYYKRIEAENMYKKLF